MFCRAEMFYRMAPQESVLVGIGFVCEMPFPIINIMEVADLSQTERDIGGFGSTGLNRA